MVLYIHWFSIEITLLWTVLCWTALETNFLRQGILLLFYFLLWTIFIHICICTQKRFFQLSSNISLHLIWAKNCVHLPLLPPTEISRFDAPSLFCGFPHWFIIFKFSSIKIFTLYTTGLHKVTTNTLKYS